MVSQTYQLPVYLSGFRRRSMYCASSWSCPEHSKSEFIVSTWSDDTVLSMADNTLGESLGQSLSDKGASLISRAFQETKRPNKQKWQIMLSNILRWAWLSSSIIDEGNWDSSQSWTLQSLLINDKSYGKQWRRAHKYIVHWFLLYSSNNEKPQLVLQI